MLLDTIATNYLLDEETRRYALAVQAAIKAGTPLRVRRVCTECRYVPYSLDDEHTLIDHPGIGPIVVIGCEGFWLIDPASVGITGRNWQAPPIAEAPADRVDHSTCPDDAHQRDAESYEEPQDADGNMLCADCRQPVAYCDETHGHYHLDPQAPACFLIA